ncbi:phage portal protein [Paenibacillus polymyxa]|uniref:phage portal protein n=1 Tax=Paenibacillus TaxID=44249 RepID=UPI000D30BFC9|nr:MULTISPECIES: phage portal protein [Paenibacillus]KAF6616189.1 phage portal protein [Paenibacillus sp. EKM101P]KAF6618023.1 phage portal protein [Paenibacillus sp. EKM102P]KAF6626051.1 phage portal protein [Paenibacillus sp. EKM10P]KAF6642596.1 phage portal protein [Paenibacillus sp. EKM11P]MBY0020929.1 phage portal protein [Paenibacillus polymyxa]
MQITESIIIECLNELQLAALAKQKYADYYDGQHAILKNYAMQESRSNQKLIFNFPRKFVDNEVGYLLGKPVNYVSKSDQDEAIHNIDVHMSHWNKEHNLQLRKQSEIFGESFELNYIDSDGQFSATVLSPLNAYVLEDGTAERNVLLGLHKFMRRFDKQVYLDVYTDHEILHYTISSDNKNNQMKQNQAPELKYIGKHNHIFGRVPLISCPANTERKSGFQDVISLFDAYNALNSDLVNEIADHRNAYLVIENAKLEAEDLLNMKKMGIIQVPAGGKVSWLTKEINDSFVKNELDNIERKIFDMMDQVNFNENWASNTSSLALRNKLLNLENRVAMREALMEKAIKQRLRNFFAFLHIKEGVQYDYRDIAVKFTRNLPTDLVGMADVIVKLKEVVSQETLLTLLPFVENPKLEFNKFHAEQQRLVGTDKKVTNAE